MKEIPSGDRVTRLISGIMLILSKLKYQIKH
ncbi:MAG: hypothetical protein CLLPBCKN_003794 [Chroococcidiopsis cubana SAG 39.79]|uniref:Uncharacterized protein n=1 Tax=Chroococcidiopsis thermalis (strain PCC 7203) TaxID=251229 RepID=K9TY33_CHRTP|nr:hypothetical protein Chro_1567 [Chroococcidiopsis thermalis PCC 7203]MDZ4874398.1 hypothetical protein [Chroococcidiopsis cubana SAG 39.79]